MTDGPVSSDVFYDSLGASYDAMTRFEQRLKRQVSVFRELLSDCKVRRVASAGCGSGVHAIALAKLGLEVVAFDPSSVMLELAHHNAERNQVTLQLMRTTIARAHEQFVSPVDAVFCLGNTLPHILTPEELRIGLRGLRRLLSPGGSLWLEWLNYARILKERQRLVGLHQVDNRLFFRFYDFLSRERLQFNIVVVGMEDSTVEQWLSTSLRPWLRAEVADALQECGFRHIDIYSDLNRSAFDDTSSSNLVICAQ